MTNYPAALAKITDLYKSVNCPSADWDNYLAKYPISFLTASTADWFAGSLATISPPINYIASLNVNLSPKFQSRTSPGLNTFNPYFCLYASLDINYLLPFSSITNISIRPLIELIGLLSSITFPLLSIK